MHNNDSRPFNFGTSLNISIPCNTKSLLTTEDDLSFKAPNFGKLGKLWYEIMERLDKRTHPKIKTQIYMDSGWLEESGVGNDAKNIEIETLPLNAIYDEVHGICFGPWFRAMPKVK